MDVLFVTTPLANGTYVLVARWLGFWYLRVASGDEVGRSRVAKQKGRGRILFDEARLSVALLVPTPANVTGLSCFRHPVVVSFFSV